jgi:hypothetical protein
LVLLDIVFFCLSADPDELGLSVSVDRRPSFSCGQLQCYWPLHHRFLMCGQVKSLVVLAFHGFVVVVDYDEEQHFLQPTKRSFVD